jgi:putative transcriptional regulator
MSDSVRGKLLIANPALADDNFSRTVVLVAEHTDEGALGLVLNRTAETTVAEAVPDFAELVEEDEPLSVGGPVAREGVLVLGELEEPDRAAFLIEEDLGLLPTDAEPDELITMSRRARVFAGHAGWGPGQLDAELESDESWIVAEPTREDIFDTDPDELWPSVLTRMGGSYALVARMPLEPWLN